MSHCQNRAEKIFFTNIADHVLATSHHPSMAVRSEPKILVKISMRCSITIDVTNSIGKRKHCRLIRRAHHFGDSFIFSHPADQTAVLEKACVMKDKFDRTSSPEPHDRQFDVVKQVVTDWRRHQQFLSDSSVLSAWLYAHVHKLKPSPEMQWHIMSTLTAEVDHQDLQCSSTLFLTLFLIRP